MTRHSAPRLWNQQTYHANGTGKVEHMADGPGRPGCCKGYLTLTQKLQNYCCVVCYLNVYPTTTKNNG